MVLIGEMRVSRPSGKQGTYGIPRQCGLLVITENPADSSEIEQRLNIASFLQMKKSWQITFF